MTKQIIEVIFLIKTYPSEVTKLQQQRQWGLQYNQSVLKVRIVEIYVN